MRRSGPIVATARRSTAPAVVQPVAASARAYALPSGISATVTPKPSAASLWTFHGWMNLLIRTCTALVTACNDMSDYCRNGPGASQQQP